MRITVVALGTRGDVTPFVALAIRLRTEGHTVRIATHRDFEPLVVRHGLDFHGLPSSFQNLIGSPEGRRALGVPDNAISGLRGLFLPFRDCAEALYAECWEATANADAIIGSPLARRPAELIAEKRNLPMALCLVVPSLASRCTPHPVFPAFPLGPIYNRATYSMALWVTRHVRSDIFGRWEREANRLSPEQAHPLRLIVLAAVSPLVVPRPYDWPDIAHITGFWFLPEDPNPAIPDNLREFIDRGPAPICLGFGSMADDRSSELRDIVVDVLRRLGLRAVIVTGSGEALGGLRQHEDICEVAFADYRWLFSRAAAVVHQGGIGTASFCLTAGVPQVVVGYCLDHRFWGWRLNEIGVAPRALSRHRLTAASLTSAVREVLENPAFRAKAGGLAHLIRAEDGVGNAVRLLNDHFAGTPAA